MARTLEQLKERKRKKISFFGTPIRLDAVRTVLAIAAVKGWTAESADVDGACFTPQFRGKNVND